eukprot:PITA_19688
MIIEAHKGLQKEPCSIIRHEGYGVDALFFGLEFWQKNGEIFLEQGRYATKILKIFRMQDCRPMVTPMITNWKTIYASGDKEVDPTLYRQLIGSLMYLVNTRPCICFTVNTLSQFMVESKIVHWVISRHILIYVHGTVGLELKYTQEDDVRLSRFTDADWAGILVDRKSTSGYYFSVGSGMISWCSRKKKSVALSSVEVEYMAANTTTCEAIWLRKFPVSLLRKNIGESNIYCDNHSCIKLSENPVFHDRLNHIDIRCHFIRDCVQCWEVQMQYVPTSDQQQQLRGSCIADAVVDNSSVGSAGAQFQLISELCSGWWEVGSYINNTTEDGAETE